MRLQEKTDEGWRKTRLAYHQRRSEGQVNIFLTQQAAVCELRSVTMSSPHAMDRLIFWPRWDKERKWICDTRLCCSVLATVFDDFLIYASRRKLGKQKKLFTFTLVNQLKKKKTCDSSLFRCRHANWGRSRLGKCMRRNGNIFHLAEQDSLMMNLQLRRLFQRQL